MSALYYPYFRGRQFELIALRELVTEKRLGTAGIIPVVEPVKLSSTLISTLQAFVDADKSIGVVINPVYGNFLDEVASSDEETRNKVRDLFSQPSLFRAYIQRRNIDVVVDKQLKFLRANSDRSIAVYQSPEMLEASLALQQKMNFSYGMSLVPDSISFRRKIRANRILFHDCFNKKPRNSDYRDDEDELFSEDILYYTDDGYSGFGDYSIIGQEYVDGGFAPWAVAFHIVYKSGEGALRIRHFVSDRNDGIEDAPGKFAEAARAFSKWLESDGKDCLRTLGITRICDAYQSGQYPGLGALKKFAIMHHLELVSTMI